MSVYNYINIGEQDKQCSKVKTSKSDNGKTTKQVKTSMEFKTCQFRNKPKNVKKTFDWLLEREADKKQDRSFIEAKISRYKARQSGSKQDISLVNHII